jgi:AcrR family transcriptional regulator
MSGSGTPSPISTRPDPDGPSLAQQAALRSMAQKVTAREEEAKSLMYAGAAVMTRLGTTRRAKVAEIVAEAGLSNQAFYRHFASKDDLVAALVDDGARRLVRFLTRKMEDEAEPIEKVRAWIRGVFSQAIDERALAPTRAINWNRSTLAFEADTRARLAESMVWQALEEPLGELGSRNPTGDAYLIGKLVFTVLAEALWSDAPPSEQDFVYVEEFCIAGLRHD